MKNPITAQRLVEALARKNMLPVELATNSGVSQSSISQYMNGSHAPSNISSAKMARVLDVSPLWLMGFEVSMEKSQTNKEKYSVEKAHLIPKIQGDAEMMSFLEMYYGLDDAKREYCRNMLSNIKGMMEINHHL